MGASDLRRLAALPLLLACASAQPPARSLPPQTMTQPASEAEEAQGADPSDTASAPASRPSPDNAPRDATPAAEAASGKVESAERADPDPTLVVIDPGGSPALKPGTLAEASRTERQRRAQAGEPVAVINQKTLPKYTAGRVTTGPPVAPKSEAASTAAREAAEEVYWRGRVRDLRAAWRQAADSLPALDREAETLRVRFYAEDDPYVRDGRIKPEWDLVLDTLRRTREDIERLKRELAVALEEGRFRGALPGWLRDGEELEPAPPRPRPGSRVVGEPEVVEGAQSEEPRVLGEEPPG